MLFKSQSKIIDILHEQPASAARCSTYVGGIVSHIEFCVNSTSLSGRSNIGTYGDQLSLLINIYKESAGLDNDRAFKRFLERSYIDVGNEEFPLKDVLKAMEASDFSQSTPHIVARKALESTGRRGANELAVTSFVQSQALTALLHTGKMETVYLALNNPEFLQISSQYHNDSKALISYSKELPSTSGSMAAGIRMVVIGKDASTPQGFIQSAVLMAEDYCAPSHDNLNLVGSLQAANKGKAMFAAMPAMNAMMKMVGPSSWEDGIVSSVEIGQLNEARDKLHHSNLTGIELSQMAYELMEKVGEYRMRADRQVITAVEDVSPSI